MRIRCAGLPLSLLLLGSAVQAQRTVPGWTYAMNVTFDSGTGPSNRGSMAMRYRSTADVLRTEMLQIAGTANRVTGGVDIEGIYTLMNDKDSTYTTVMPAQRSAMVMPNPMSMFADREKPTLDVNTTTQSVEDLGPGDKILGHATHHYRMTTAGRMTVKTAEGICTRSMNGETEVWVAPDVDMVPAMSSVMAHLGGSLPDSAPRASASSSSSSWTRGVPLRTKMRTVAVMPTGESRVIETTVEYVELSNAPLDASLFAIPADYHVMDMRKEMPAIMSRAADAAAVDSSLRTRMCPN